jgi:SAM-dependent methyltransferase
VIERITSVVPAPPDKPIRPETAQGQQRARRLALNPDTWDRQEAAGMRATFDEAASGWDGDRGGYRRPVLADALARGGPFPPGLALEIASGTGLLTPLIQAVWPRVVAVDLSSGMLARSAAAHRLQADAAHLPLVSGCADAVVIGDGPLFAAEIARVMTERAVLVLSNALGRGAPFYVPTEVVAEAMTAAAGRPWDAVESQAHWGSWAVLRRAGGPGRPGARRLGATGARQWSIRGGAGTS